MLKIRTGLLSVVVLLGMAGNSLLARFALGNHWIDPLPFTTARLASGAGMLLLLSLATRTRPFLQPLMPIMLWLYAIAFAYGYMRLGAATGTLFLFFAIQAAMLAWEIRLGYRLSTVQWVGSALTLLGLWLLLGDAAVLPSLSGAVLMLGAGVAWAAYSIMGRNSKNNLASTSANFIYSAIAALIFYAVSAGANSAAGMVVTQKGVMLAVISGAITSALVYVLWYRLMKILPGAVSATMQMIIPVLVALGAVPLLNEPLSPQLLLAGAVMLSGILMVTVAGGR